MLRLPLRAIGAVVFGVGLIEAVFALIDLVIGGEGGPAFGLSAILSLFIGGGLFMTTLGHETAGEELNRKGAFLLTAGSWIALPVFASFPFALSPLDLTLVDAVFETVSGVTTTGSTVLSGLDTMDPALLLWRSMLQWIGGVGIIVMAVILLPVLRVGGMQLFQIESSDVSGERIISNPIALMRSIGVLYAALTGLCAAAYFAAGMSAFDALNHAMTTLATGGYSTHDASLGYFRSPAIEWIAVVFMIAAALPFMAYLKAIQSNISGLLSDPQVRTFLVFVTVLCVVAAIFLTRTGGGGFGGDLRRVAVNAVSVITTTGFASEDYTLWGAGFVGLFFALTFIGGCAGSTSGAVKIYRYHLFIIFAFEHLRRLYSPSMVRPRSYGSRRLDSEIAQSVLAFLSLFVGAFSVGALLLAFTGLDLVTALSGAATALCNVGPGLGPEIGPAGNFANMPDAAKWILIGLMLLGRLELFVILVLLDPLFWR